MAEIHGMNPSGEGGEVAGNGANCRLHFHSGDAQSVLALSQLIQPSSKKGPISGRARPRGALL